MMKQETAKIALLMILLYARAAFCVAMGYDKDMKNEGLHKFRNML